MSYELFMARRLSLRTGAVGARVAVAGVGLALAAMLIAVSVCQGFKREIRQKVMGFDSQLTVACAQERTPVRLTPNLMAAIASALPSTASATAVARQPAILKTDSAFAGIIVKASADTARVPFIEQSLVAGQMPTSRNQIAISRLTARQLGVEQGQKVFAYFTVGEAVYTRRLLVTGIYDTHFGDYDKALAFAPLSLIQGVNKVGPDICSSIEINGLATDADIDTYAGTLRDALAQALYDEKVDALHAVASIHESAALYYNWLALLDTNVTVLLSLMAVVAAFTLISSLIVIILERVPMIGILKALGATNSGVGRVFIIVAERLVLRGLLLGNAVGLGLLWLQSRFHLVPLNPEAYYLDSVPVHVDWWWVLGLNAAAVVLAALILVLPARVVATISPSKAIRWE